MKVRPFIITHEPVNIGCVKRGCRGVMLRVTLSRLEEGLGHEGFACDHCGHRIKYVPKKEGQS